ncbi:hypothetical protein [Psychromonas sp. L1A2]|uniref:hypothetical protein n=1 Tax=Psychromonas sp. L1A2 TaxID=2686356 RepID=UPI0013577D39|nr:hypothetical protein [Psychromonas sp. L1A2]
MSNAENKNKEKISPEVLFRCTEDLRDSLEKQSDATRKVSTALENLNTKIDGLEKAFKDSSTSSGRVTKALNWLTFALVLIGVAQLIIA